MSRPRLGLFYGTLHGCEIKGVYVGSHMWEECEWKGGGWMDPGFTMTDQEMADQLEIERIEARAYLAETMEDR